MRQQVGLNVEAAKRVLGDVLVFPVVDRVVPMLVGGAEDVGAVTQRKGRNEGQKKRQ